MATERPTALQRADPDLDRKLSDLRNKSFNGHGTANRVATLADPETPLTTPSRFNGHGTANRVATSSVLGEIILTPPEFQWPRNGQPRCNGPFHNIAILQHLARVFAQTSPF
jgi:hypothetical protein